MFKCANCNMDSQPNEPMTKVVIQKRQRSYYNQFKELIGKGWEIVKEIGVCKKCSKFDYPVDCESSNQSQSRLTSPLIEHSPKLAIGNAVDMRRHK